MFNKLFIKVSTCTHILTKSRFCDYNNEKPKIMSHWEGVNLLTAALHALVLKEHTECFMNSLNYISLIIPIHMIVCLPCHLTTF